MSIHIQLLQTHCDDVLNLFAELLRSYLEFGVLSNVLHQSLHISQLFFCTGEYIFDFAVVIFGVCRYAWITPYVTHCIISDRRHSNGSEPIDLRNTPHETICIVSGCKRSSVTANPKLFSQ